MNFIARKLRTRSVWERILRERLSEPLHLNLLSIPVAIAGSMRAKAYFDLILRQQHAFGLLTAADKARLLGLDSVTVVELGVANGAGLLNICEIACRLSGATGVAFRVAGFDSGTGMPAPVDFRDHPEHYQHGDFPMQHPKRLRARLPDFASLHIGDVRDTVPAFLDSVTPDAPIGFVSVDLDFYSSTLRGLELLAGPAERYLPTVAVYFDDVLLDEHNSWCGERAAIADFNRRHELRKIEAFTALRQKRLFKNAGWIDQMHALHVLDHPWRNGARRIGFSRILGNPYTEA